MILTFAQSSKKITLPKTTGTGYISGITLPVKPVAVFKKST